MADVTSPKPGRLDHESTPMTSAFGQTNPGQPQTQPQPPFVGWPDQPPFAPSAAAAAQESQLFWGHTAVASGPPTMPAPDGTRTIPSPTIPSPTESPVTTGFRPVGEPVALSPRSHSGFRAALAGGLVGAIVAGGVAYATVKLTDAPPAPAAATTVAERPGVTNITASLPSGTPSLGGIDTKAVIRAVEPSVVAIEIGAQGRSGTVQAVAAGSGVVISADGLVVTNAHVVALTDQFGRALLNPVITVKTIDGRELKATVVGSAPDNDIALVKVTDAAGLTPAKLGNSASLEVGDDVVAIGNALDLGDTPTITRGIVSALDRTLDVDANTTLKHLIQTDASINHGNSGGALVNSAGEVVGINSAGIPDAQNVGFAIAMDTVKPLIEQLRAGNGGGSAAKPSTSVAYLGVSTSQGTNGVTVTGVGDGTAAATAGIRVGDVIQRIDGNAVTTTAEVGTVLRSHKPGDNITVVVQRNGTTQSVTAQLGARSS